jgi:hypothetical protein
LFLLKKLEKSFCFLSRATPLGAGLSLATKNFFQEVLVCYFFVIDFVFLFVLVIFFLFCWLIATKQNSNFY